MQPQTNPSSTHRQGSTQRDRILRLLAEACGWVAASELAKVSLQYSARIFELRRLGYDIRNRVLLTNDGRKLGAFRLESQTTQRPQCSQPAEHTATPRPKPEQQPTLFSMTRLPP
jgi:hypothetical protein